MSEKTNAHIDEITSVAFSPDGKTIVSGSADETIIGVRNAGTLKVWDAVNFVPFNDADWEEVQPGAWMEEYGRAARIKHWRNTKTGERLANKPSAGAPVVGTLKFWGEQHQNQTSPFN